MYYVSKDYLGSILLLTRQDGTVAEEYSYDAWGRRRNPNNWEDYNVSPPTILYRGYTGHEHLDEFGLINMNGRTYDPTLGRFLNPDNFVQAPDNPQSYNRYTYCKNNPLKYNDPSGWCDFSSLQFCGDESHRDAFEAFQLYQDWLEVNEPIESADGLSTDEWIALTSPYENAITDYLYSLDDDDPISKTFVESIDNNTNYSSFTFQPHSYILDHYLITAYVENGIKTPTHYSLLRSEYVSYYTLSSTGNIASSGGICILQSIIIYFKTILIPFLDLKSSREQALIFLEIQFIELINLMTSFGLQIQKFWTIMVI